LASRQQGSTDRIIRPVADGTLFYLPNAREKAYQNLKVTPSIP